MNIDSKMVVLDIKFTNINIDEVIDNIEDILHELDIKVLRTIKHVFPNGGATILKVLSASHIAIHTWPEYNYMSIDIFTCSGEGNANDISNAILIKHSKNIDKVHSRSIDRGEFIR